MAAFNFKLAYLSWDNIVLQYVYLTVLSILAFLDSNGGKTTPLYAWRACIILGFALAVLPAARLLGLVCQNRHLNTAAAARAGTDDASTSKSKSSKSSARTTLLGNVNSSGPAQPAGAYVGREELGMLVWCATYYQSLIAYAALMGQVVFIYDYTSGTTAYQATIDMGYPPAGNLPMAMFSKLLMLGSIRTLWVAQTTLLLVYRATNHLYEKKDE